MRQTIAELVAVLAMDSTKFKQGIASAQTSSTKLAQNLGAIGKRMTMMVSLPLAAMGVAVTKMAMDFETKMTNVFTLMDEATIHSRDWKQEVLDLSKKVGQSTDVLSKGLYDIVSAGIDAGKAMDVLEVASKAATAGVSDTATAVKGITTVLNAYGLAAEDAEYVSDILFTTIRYGVTTFDELSPAIGKVVGVAATANVSFKEVGAALAVMTKAGLSTDMATTALKQTIMAFLKPTDDAVEAAAELGINLSAVELSTKGLGGALSEISEALNISVDEMIALGEAGVSDTVMLDMLAVKSGLTAEKIAEIFPNIRALLGAMVLLKDEDFAEELEHQENAAGATSEAFSKMAETTKFQFDLALSSLKATGIEIGTKLLPLATRLFKSVGDLADGWGELGDSSQNAILQMAGIAIIIPPLIWIISKLSLFIGKVKMAIPIITKFATGIGLATSQLTAIILAFPIGAKILSNWTNKMIEASKGTIGWNEAMQELVKITMPWEWAKVLNEWTLGLLGVKEATDETADSETALTDKIKENANTIMEWRYANEGLVSVLDELTFAYETGELSLENYDKAVQFLVDSEGTYKGTTEEVLEAVGALSEEHYKAKEAIEKADASMNVYVMTAEELSDAFNAGLISSEQYAEGLRSIEESAGDSQEAIDDLRSSFNKLTKTLFDGITTYNDFEEGQIAVKRAQEALSEAIAEYGIESDEATKASNNLDSEIISLINDSFALSTSIYATTEQQKEAREEAIKLGAEWIETGRISIEQFMAMASEFGISGMEIIDTAEEMGINIKGYLQEAADSGEENFILMAQQFGLTKEEIVRLAREMGLEIDMAAVDRTIDIDTDTSGVDEGVEHVNKELSKITRSIMIGVGISMGFSEGDIISSAKGNLIKSAQSGLMQAQNGLELSNSNAVPVLIHPPEIILNKEQALTALWNMANQPIASTESQGTSIVNNFNIAELTVREEADIGRIAEELKDMQDIKHRGVGIK